MQLNVDLIRTEGDTQPRAKLDIVVISEYAELIRAGAIFPPITVFYDGQSYWLVDGFHRYYAWRSARPEAAIEVEVHQGALEDARWYSYGVNKTHGLQRTNADKERAVRTALRHPKALTLSNRRIAEHCGVTGNTVARYRQELEAAFPVAPASPEEPGDQPWHSVPPRLRTGRDGRTINTARIGANRRLTSQACRSSGVVGQQPHEPVSVNVELSSNDPRHCAHKLLEQFPFEYLEKIFLNVLSLHRRHLPQGATR